MYRLVFNGERTQTLNIGGLSIPGKSVQYFEKLPAPIGTLRSIPGVVVDTVDAVPAPEVQDQHVAKLTGSVGIKWTGTASFRGTEHGMFKKDVTRWDLPDNVVNELAQRIGFVKIQ